MGWGGGGISWRSSISPRAPAEKKNDPLSLPKGAAWLAALDIIIIIHRTHYTYYIFLFL